MTVVDYFGYLLRHQKRIRTEVAQTGWSSRESVSGMSIPSAPFKDGFAAFLEVASSPPQ
jgi:hypothetical protein